MADWCVYILRCRDGTLYTGITNDLPRRLAAHAAGTAARYTASRRPVALAWREPQPDRPAALRREAAIRKLGRAGKLALVGSVGSGELALVVAAAGVGPSRPPVGNR